MAIVLSLVAGYSLFTVFGIALSPSMLLSFAVFSCAATIVVLCQQGSNVQCVFLAFAIPIGLSIAIIPPAITGIGWDDAIHFARANAISYVIDPSYSDGDLDLSVAAVDPDFYLPDKSESSIRSYNERINNGKYEGAHIEPGLKPIVDPKDTGQSYQAFALTSLGYMPSAIGLWFGRLLHLPLVDIFKLGRILNVLFYVFICYFAIKIIPTRKTLLSLIALIPTSLFMAANYSYDGWINALMLLAVALSVKLICDTGPIRAWDLALTLGVFFLAFAPKAVYFPLLGILILIPKDRFRLKSTWKKWICILIVFTVFVMASFALPFVCQGEFGDDKRGGTDVDSMRQISFILHNPALFSKILASELFNFFWNPACFEKATITFAGLGSLSSKIPFFQDIPLLLLLFCAVTDTNEVGLRLSTTITKLWTSFLIMCASMIIFTSLYVSYNDVGSVARDSNGVILIKGVQMRYIIPLLPPALVLVVNFRIAREIKARYYSIVVQSLMAFIGFACVAYLLVLPMKM